MKVKYGGSRLVLALFFLLSVGLLSFACARKDISESLLGSPQHHFKSGEKLLTLGKYDDAMREFRLAEELDPDFPRTHVGMGLVWAHRGDLDKGMEAMERAKTLARSNGDRVYRDIGLIRFCVLSKALGYEAWLGEAEAAYHHALEISPDSAEAHYYMGVAYAEAGQVEEAALLFRKVIALNKTHVRDARLALEKLGADGK